MDPARTHITTEREKREKSAKNGILARSYPAKSGSPVGGHCTCSSRISRIGCRCMCLCVHVYRRSQSELKLIKNSQNTKWTAHTHTTRSNEEKAIPYIMAAKRKASAMLHKVHITSLCWNFLLRSFWPVFFSCVAIGLIFVFQRLLFSTQFYGIGFRAFFFPQSVCIWMHFKWHQPKVWVTLSLSDSMKGREHATTSLWPACRSGVWSLFAFTRFEAVVRSAIRSHDECDRTLWTHHEPLTHIKCIRNGSGSHPYCSTRTTHSMWPRKWISTEWKNYKLHTHH